MLSIEELSELNHWWKLGQVKEDFALPYKRQLFKKIVEYIEVRQIIGLVGLRRVGKTTLFYQFIEYLIENKTDVKNILYFSFDESKYEIREILKFYEGNIMKGKIDNEKTYVFFDEIQKLEDWQNKIKIIYDTYPKIKFFISGSASINILLPAKESLAGRVFYFELDLLSFEEFLELRGKDISEIKRNPELWKKEIRIELNNYLLKPMPEIVNASEEIAKKYLKESVIEKVILRDLRGLFEIKEIDIIEKLINVIASEPGLIINLDDLSKDFGVSRQVLSNYLYYLQCCFLIKKLNNFRGSFKASSRKLKKYYLYNPCFSIALSSPERGRLIENLVAFKIKTDYYWREREKEVDFILKNKTILPVEVKYKNQIKKNEIKGLLHFMDKFKVKKALIINEDKEGKETIKGKKIAYIPLWKWFCDIPM